MSSEGFNAENRNNINNIVNIYQRVNYPRVFMGRIMNEIHRTSRCSFCNDIGHNIRTCTDIRITDFENDCRMSKVLSDLSNNSNNTFKQWLMDYYLDIDREVVKAFSISKCNCRVNSNVDIIIDRITRYIYEEPEETLDYIAFPAIPELVDYTMDTNMSILSLYDSINTDRTDKFNITTNIETIDEKQSEEICECVICYEDGLQRKNIVTLNCQHKFCKDCVKGCLKNTPVYKDLPRCALCRADISEITIYDESVKVELSDLIV
jgi:hypothetical protein